jgi:hypothetical protein
MRRHTPLGMLQQRRLMQVAATTAANKHRRCQLAFAFRGEAAPRPGKASHSSSYVLLDVFSPLHLLAPGLSST